MIRTRLQCDDGYKLTARAVVTSPTPTANQANASPSLPGTPVTPVNTPESPLPLPEASPTTYATPTPPSGDRNVLPYRSLNPVPHPEHRLPTATPL